MHLQATPAAPVPACRGRCEERRRAVEDERRGSLAMV